MFDKSFIDVATDYIAANPKYTAIAIAILIIVCIVTIYKLRCEMIRVEGLEESDKDEDEIDLLIEKVNKSDPGDEDGRDAEVVRENGRS